VCACVCVHVGGKGGGRKDMVNVRERDQKRIGNRG
jgi:alanyl-tRNA synthetase